MDINISPEKLCMGCMKSRDEVEVCPFCGFDEAGYAPAPHHLPLRTIIARKYYVGRVLETVFFLQNWYAAIAVVSLVKRCGTPPMPTAR